VNSCLSVSSRNQALHVIYKHLDRLHCLMLEAGGASKEVLELLIGSYEASLATQGRYGRTPFHLGGFFVV